MDLLTKDTQTAYKIARATIEILPVDQDQIQTDETKQLLLTDCAKAFGAVARNTPWAILYENCQPRSFTQEIRSGHIWTKLCTKYSGNIAPLQYNNKGVYQGSPLRAILSVL